MQINEILKLKFPQADFRKDIILQDDGEGIYIAEWNEALGPLPDAAQLALWEQEVGPLKLLVDIQQQRKEAYLSIGEQLDMLYWDKVNNTNLWQEHISTIKQQFPKPE